MCKEAHDFAGWHKNVVVKLPTKFLKDWEKAKGIA
jgi:hypothetical protein